MKLEANLKVLSFTVKIVIKTCLRYKSQTKNLQNNYKFTIPYILVQKYILWLLSKTEWCLKAPCCTKVGFPPKQGKSLRVQFNLIFIYLEISFQPSPGELGCMQVCAQVQELLLKTWQQCQVKHLWKQKYLNYLR